MGGTRKAPVPMAEQNRHVKATSITGSWAFAEPGQLTGKIQRGDGTRISRFLCSATLNFLGNL